MDIKRPRLDKIKSQERSESKLYYVGEVVLSGRPFVKRCSRVCACAPVAGSEKHPTNWSLSYVVKFRAHPIAS